MVDRGSEWLLVISLILVTAFVTVLTLVGIQVAQGLTQFYYDLPDQIEITNGTIFQAAYYDDDGEGTYFIWNFIGLKDNPYDFNVHADLIPDEEKYNKTKSVDPQAELVHKRYDHKFAIDENITIGKNFELCVMSNTFNQCKWPQPVDEFGRVLVDITSNG